MQILKLYQMLEKEIQEEEDKEKEEDEQGYPKSHIVKWKVKIFIHFLPLHLLQYSIYTQGYF